MGTGSLASFARFWRASPASYLVLLMAVVVLAGGTAFAPPLPAAASPPAKRHTPAAPAGAGPVNRPLPASATPNHAYPKGTRPPVVPPGVRAAGAPRKLSAGEWAAVPKASSRTSSTGALVASDSGAVNLTLRSGFDFNDTSLVLYFDVADPGVSGWQSWKATAYDPDTGAAQDSVALQPSDAKTCSVPARYCRSFGTQDGWSLVGGHNYFVTITVTFPDGTQAVSPASAQAAARTTSDPPAVPATQLNGCACSDVLFPTDSGQMVRGLGVGTATGSYTVRWPDLQLAGFGATFNATRTYYSANTTAGMLGIGWSWSYDIKVIPPATGQTSVTVRAEDGAQAVYQAGSNGAYTRPPGVRSNLSATSGGGWKLVTPGHTGYTFDPTGRLTSVLDTHGNGVTLAYTANSMTLTDAAGRVVTGTFSSGLLTRLALPDRRSVSYRYTNGMLTSTQDAGGNTWTFGYTNQLLATIVDPMGRTQVTNTYSGGRVVKQVDASGAATTFGWNPTNQESTTVDADGVTYYDGYRGNTLVYTQNGNGDTTNRRYDQAVNPNLLVDAEGNQTLGAYDGSSNVLSMTAPDPFNFQVGNTFDPNNNLTTHTDALGQVTRFGYTSTNEINSILAPAGDNTTLSYDNRGLLTTMTDGRGKTTTMSYDAAGNLVSQTSPMGEVTTYTYDSSGRILTEVDPRGNLAGATALNYTTTYSYDNLDRLVGILAPRKAHASTTSYDSVGEVTATGDPLGHTTSYAYGKVIGRTLTVTDPNAGVMTYTYTSAGRESSVTDQVGDKTTMTYDNRGDIATVTSPGGNVAGANPADYTTTYTYDFNRNRVHTSHPYPGGGPPVTTDTSFDQLNRVTSTTDPLGNTSKAGYDNNSNVTSTADPLGGNTTYGYDADGRPITVTAPGGGGTGITYDAVDNVIRSTSASGGVTTYTYNDDERIATAVDPRGNAAGANPADYTVSYRYDPAGDLTSVTDQLGRATSFGYDSNNRLTAGTDAGGHTTTYKYLDDDTLQSVVGPDGNAKLATVYSYDNAGNVVSRTDGLGNTRYTWDHLGRLTDTKDPLNRDTLFSYDAEGNLTRSVAPGGTDPSTRTIGYTYDILDRRTSESQAGGPVYNWGYDAKNQVTSLADPTGVRTQSYDSLGRISATSRGGQTFSYGYDPNGNVTSTTWPDGTTISRTYNTNNDLTTLTAQGGQAGGTAAQYTFGYDPSGRLTTTAYPTANHLVTDRSYDRAGRLSDLNSHNDAGTVARYQVSRDPVGNPTGITTTRGAVSQHVAYTYDTFDRLTAACVGTDCGASATGKIAYSYDEIGNRLSQTLSGSAGNSQTSYTYNSGSELTGATVTTPSGRTTTTYAYDPSGNLVQAGNNTFTYNLDHTLASASLGGNTTSYAYDAQGIQLSAATQLAIGGTQTRTWQTDVNASLPRLAEQTTSSAVGSATQGYLDGPYGTPLGLLTGGQTDSFALDTVDGVANVLTPAGDSKASYDYDPFGNARSDGTASGTSTVDNPIQFAGGYQDSTLGGDYSTLARVYDPTTGRFGGLDPAAPSTRRPSTSPYAYVADKATNYRDPSGALACQGNFPDHNEAMEMALPQLDAAYGPDNVYAECPVERRRLHNVPGTGPG